MELRFLRLLLFPFESFRSKKLQWPLWVRLPSASSIEASTYFEIRNKFKTIRPETSDDWVKEMLAMN